MDWLFTVADFLLFIGALGGVVFAISYASFFHWTKTPAGRALLAFVVSLDAIFALNVIGRVFGTEFTAWPYLRVLAYLFTAVSVWSLVITLWRNWRTGKAGVPIETRNIDLP